MNKLGQKKAIVYGLVLAAAVIGLAADRLGRTEASPDSKTPALSSNLIVKPAAVAAKVEGPVVARIFDHPESPARGEPAERSGRRARDAFKMTPLMGQTAEAKQHSEDAKEKLHQEAEHFRRSHQLKGTIVTGRRSWALIDDRIYRVGDRVGDFVLEQVDQDRVCFRKDKLTIVLVLPTP